MSEKERVCDASGSGENASIECYYMVFDEDGDVFSNKDDLLYFKFDSASVQARLKQGETYDVTAVGWRVPLLSMKPNIVKVNYEANSY